MKNKKLNEPITKTEFSNELEKVLEYYEFLKKSAPYLDSAYEQIEKDTTDSSGIKKVTKMRPQKGPEDSGINLCWGYVDFSQYSDSTYLYPWDVVFYVISRFLLSILFSALVFFLLISNIPTDKALYAALFSFCFIVILFPFSIVMLISALKQICGRQKNYYSLLKKIKFTKENKNELWELMKDNEVLREIFQVKYGKNIFVWNLLRYSFFFIGEDGKVWYFSREYFWKKRTWSMWLAIIFGIVFLVGLFVRIFAIHTSADSIESFLYNIFLIATGIPFVVNSITFCYWVFIFQKVLKNREFKNYPPKTLTRKKIETDVPPKWEKPVVD